jgi:hypothetical protein
MSGVRKTATIQRSAPKFPTEADCLHDGPFPYLQRLCTRPISHNSGQSTRVFCGVANGLSTRHHASRNVLLLLPHAQDARA